MALLGHDGVCKPERIALDFPFPLIFGGKKCFVSFNAVNFNAVIVIIIYIMTDIILINYQ